MVVKKILSSLDVALITLFAALTAVGAYIQIPLPLVPFTLQTLFTYLAGAVLGSRRGALSQLAYVLMGIVGLPVFAGGKAGFGVLIGLTGGYLIGFIAGAFVIGKMCEAKQHAGFVWTLFSMLVGTAIIYAFGVLQLTYLVGNLETAITVGILPFLIGDAIKMVIATYLTLKIPATLGSLTKSSSNNSGKVINAISLKPKTSKKGNLGDITMLYLDSTPPSPPRTIAASEF